MMQKHFWNYFAFNKSCWRQNSSSSGFASWGKIKTNNFRWADQDWIGLMNFKNFADQDWIGFNFNFIGSGLDSLKNFTVCSCLLYSILTLAPGSPLISGFVIISDNITFLLFIAWNCFVRVSNLFFHCSCYSGRWLFLTVTYDLFVESYWKNPILKLILGSSWKEKAFLIVEV